jgi:hypothetical protein
MHILKIFGVILLSFVFSFSIWYLIFWFITAEDNLFIWSGWTKAAYLLLSFMAMSGIADETIKEL